MRTAANTCNRYGLWVLARLGAGEWQYKGTAARHICKRRRMQPIAKTAKPPHVKFDLFDFVKFAFGTAEDVMRPAMDTLACTEGHGAIASTHLGVMMCQPDIVNATSLGCVLCCVSPHADMLLQDTTPSSRMCLSHKATSARITSTKAADSLWCFTDSLLAQLATG